MSETRYAQLARELADGIASGRFPVGSVLPTEFELCDLYDASRHTVRAAMKELQDQGLVSRRKKLGTRVEASTPIVRGNRLSLATLEELVQFGATHVRAVQEIAEVTTDRVLAKELGCAVGRRWLRISSLRHDTAGDGLPIGWTEVYIDKRYAMLADEVQTTPDALISSLIEKRFGRRSAEIRQDVGGVIIDGPMADRLGVPTNSPGLRVVRKYLDGAGACFEVSISIHPADRFSISMRLRRAPE
ncbi:MAG: GntR family transcriptional regulator [Mesorhizobium sp.]|uniref:GntR family transcriptional regulator n=1 Tax=Mesorhizobium sp. TaxID=1871066 RepID=UPI000FE90459|nr:GntR family transcriptional regulator [Mesorhizobium sp.]RWB39727.1 MAG: GntR family transcriptional regulator [Mesorhizobium sp.]